MMKTAKKEQGRGNHGGDGYSRGYSSSYGRSLVTAFIDSVEDWSISASLSTFNDFTREIPRSDHISRQSLLARRRLQVQKAQITTDNDWYNRSLSLMMSRLNIISTKVFPFPPDRSLARPPTLCWYRIVPCKSNQDSCVSAICFIYERTSGTCLGFRLWRYEYYAGVMGHECRRAFIVTEPIVSRLL